MLVQDVRTNPPALYRLGDTVPTADGTILLLPPPGISSIAVAGTSLSINGSGGITKRAYSLLMSTNVSLPLEPVAASGNEPFRRHRPFFIHDQP